MVGNPVENVTIWTDFGVFLTGFRHEIDRFDSPDVPRMAPSVSLLAEVSATSPVQVVASGGGILGFVGRSVFGALLPSDLLEEDSRLSGNLSRCAREGMPDR